jgi:predicted phage-related endonuclease
MITHNVLQGSDEWIALRGKFCTASEAPIIMAASKKVKRDELLAIKAGYTEKEYSDWVQRNLFDKGHQAEAMARPIVETMIGEELYPVTGSEGLYLASFDGLTMMEDIGFEHKMWNEELAECVRRKELPAEYYWQLEHQLLVCQDMEKVIFAVSDGTEDNFVSMEYFRVPGRAEDLQRGWKQFDADLANYQHVVEPIKPEAAPIEAFPALSVALIGEVKSSNLPVFKSRAMAFIESINTDLQTDEDFANAEEAVKFCERAEKEIDLVKSQALSQTNTIDELFRAMDQIKALMREKRLTLDKLVKSRKETLKTEIINEARNALMVDITKANEEFRPVVVTGVTADFATAAKNKRTFASLRSAVNDELTRARLALAERRDHTRASIKLVRDAGAGYGFLFNDIQQLADKPHDHLEMIVKQRVDEHEAEQRRKIGEEVERRAQEIAAAERKAAADAKAKADAETSAEEIPEGWTPPASQPLTEGRVWNPSEREPAKERPASALDFPTAPRSTSAPAAKTRPTDDEIIEVLALHYRVHESKVIEWLVNMDLGTASNRMAANL